MISCNECLAWMDHEVNLNNSDREEMFAHLAVCDRCRAVYDALCNIDGWFQRSEAPPEGFADSVMTAIHRENREKSPLSLLKRFRFTAVAAVAAVLVLAVSAYMPKQDEALSVARSTTTVEDTAASDAVIAAYDGGGAVEDVYVILSELGCSGQLIVVEEVLLECKNLFPEGEEMVLENGETLFVLNYDEFDQNKVSITQIQVLPDGGEEMIYLYSE